MQCNVMQQKVTPHNNNNKKQSDALQHPDGGGAQESTCVWFITLIRLRTFPFTPTAFNSDLSLELRHQGSRSGTHARTHTQHKVQGH